ncbi:SHD1 [Auxenochlorella protothecoides x Auxenochlorella symbiontica]
MPGGTVDPALLPLSNRQSCVLASSIPDLQLGKDLGIPGLSSLQLKLARAPYAARSVEYTERAITLWQLEGRAPIPVEVQMEITQAPSLFALPVMQKRPWETPFQIRMSWRCSIPLRFPASVTPCALDEAAMSSPEDWTPSLEGAPTGLSLVGSSAKEREILLTAAPDKTTFEYVAMFTFPKLAFGAPSQMRPRWMAFVGRLFTPDSYLVAILKVPTVVMSRNADQQSKAQSLLWGKVMPLSSTSLDYTPFIDHVKGRFTHLGILRQLTPADFEFLAAKAGFVKVDGSIRRKPSSSEFSTFNIWLDGHLQTIHHCRAHFERLDPLILAGFACTREAARKAIWDQPPGAFLLRFGSKGGQLVMTLKSFSGSVDHVLLNHFRLQAEGLENTVQAYPEARLLLDTSTGYLHNLNHALQWHYINQDGGDVPGPKRRKDYCSSPTECSSRNQGPCEGSGSFPSLAGFPLGPGLPHGPVDMLLAPPGPGEGPSAPPSLVRGPGADAHTLYNPLIDGSFLLPSGMLPHPGSADFLHLSGGQDGPGAWN